ncbi:prepilin-type cleavage/methylation domain-containing protein [Clostridium brassicae]|uniref:Prepilin-type cleavage/methylation domain-containing protein n=1 Tax=Clostridium brassicae TaxID=2999072 RepID=A0ABT4DFK3_9CLOT|nr:prepilin-type cleavage/methylation domain-containing protein [Clostridium brassicae]MCY6960468.1 prepilin-type cleavage/methylation domain-containing protein [Clostridium brassicae]
MIKKPGIALIELVLTISIILILSGVSFGIYYKTYKCINNKFKVDMCKNGILHIINDAKNYCKINNQRGYLVFNGKDNIDFNSLNRRVKSYKIPVGFRLGDVITPSGNQIIYIDGDGNTRDACTIFFYDLKDRDYSITLRVGTNYVEIKE